jgi:orotidine-5'-phosphate decarboxylase
MLTNPIFVALDVDDENRALAIAKAVAPFVGGFKVGPRLCMRYGAPLVKKLAAQKPVFVDNKFFDIPNTMEAAVAAAFESGASFVTVHAQAGPEALRRLAELEGKLNRERPFKILSVTILTSFTQAQLPVVSRSMPIAQQVEALAELTLENGLTGLVCSADEVGRLRQRYPNAFILVPGIRLPGQDKGDQNRTADPASVLRNGASALVVGRPIVDAQDPVSAAKLFADTVRESQS